MEALAFSDFEKLDIRSGTITKVEEFPEAQKASLKLWIDFGPEIGIRKSSAQITDLYTADDLIGRQVLAVVNFNPKQIANFMSECLVLGLNTNTGVVLIQPDRAVKNGIKLS